jgi:SAM-dependent methyltransferase
MADAAAPGLPPASFDLAYCRLVLMHVPRPADALRAMAELARPGGRVVCEEMDPTRWVCDPPSGRMDRLFRLQVALGERSVAHFRLGTSLHRLFAEAGLAPAEVGANFPFALRGEAKRLIALSFLEFGPGLVREVLASPAEVEAIAAAALRLADDEATRFGFPLVVQAWTPR